MHATRTRPASHFVLVLRPPGDRPGAELQAGGKLHVGRHSSNDLVIPGKGVSRFHALVWWGEREERPVVQDVGSTNGTFVDGQRLSGPAVLRGGETVQFGTADPVKLELCWRGEEAPALLASDQDETVLFSDQGPGVTAVVPDGRGLHQRLLDLEADRRTGCVTIKARDEPIATLTFAMGRVAAAQVGLLRGPTAFERVMRFPGGYVSFTRAFAPVEADLDVSIRRYLEREREETRSYGKPSAARRGAADAREDSGEVEWPDWAEAVDRAAVAEAEAVFDEGPLEVDLGDLSDEALASSGFTLFSVDGVWRA